MKILISGFEKFGSHVDNSSEIIVKLFQQRRPDLSTIILPVSFEESWEVLKEKINLERPDHVISLGLAGNRKVISLEKVAINWIDCEIPDNAGNVIKDKMIKENGPEAYFSTLPLTDLKNLETNFPTEISLTAGSFLCNYIMYQLLDYSKEVNYRSGFIHLPHLAGEQEKIYESLNLMIDLLKA